MAQLNPGGKEMIVQPVLRLLLAFFIAIVSAISAAQAEKRIALVVGNGAYTQAAALKNPANDARAIAAALRRIGFDVIEGIDLDYSGLRRTIRSYGEKLPGAETAVFFYAGHGVQVAGENYLIPVDSQLQSETDLDFATVAVDLVLKQMDRSAKTKIIILDACRNNPFEAEMARSMGATRSAALGRGLAEIRPLGGSMISFATDPGAVAADGEGKNSPFTEALLKHIETPGLEVNVMMARVREDVYHATGERQRPWTNTSLIGEVYLTPQAEAPATPPPQAAAPQSQPAASAPRPGSAATEIEMEIWRSAERSGLAADYQYYLRKYPEGAFSELARNRIAALSAPAKEDPKGSAPQSAFAPNAPVAPNTGAPARSPADAEAALGLNREDRMGAQARLSLLGYDTRGIDGVFGPGSRAAIREWQDDEGYPRTGYFNLEQVERLVADTEADYQVWIAEQTTRAAQPTYSAYSFCSMTGAEGYGQHANSDQALWAAVNACIYNGGVPQCCANGARLLQ